MSSSEALGILKNWQTALTSISLKSIALSPQINWVTTPVKIVGVDSSVLHIQVIDSGEKKTISLVDAEFGGGLSGRHGFKGIIVTLADGATFTLEEE